MKTKKSQSVVFDLFIALSIFVLINAILIIMWDKYAEEIDEKTSQKDMWIKTYHITNLLVESQGRPSNWQDDFNTIESLGLIERDRRFNSGKLEAFLDLIKNNYSFVQNLLNIEGFEFYFKLFDKSGPIDAGGEDPLFFGIAGDVSGRTTTIRRYVYSDELCDGVCMCRERQCIIEFSLWKLK